MTSTSNNITHRISSKGPTPSPMESVASKNSSKPRSKSPFNLNANQKADSLAKKPLRRESTSISTLHPDTLYDNKYKERRSTMMLSSSVHNENLPNNISRNIEGKNSKNDKMQKFAKFNNSRLFKDKVAAEPAPTSSRITPFRMDVSGKDSLISNQDLKDSVLSKPFPFLAKGNQEHQTPKNHIQEFMNCSSIELVTSQMGRNISMEANVLNFSTLEPTNNNNRGSLENSMLTSGRKSLRLGCPDSISKAVSFEPRYEAKTEEISTQLPPLETVHEDFVKPAESTNYNYAPQEKRREKSFALPFVLSVLLVVLISALTFSIREKNSLSAVENIVAKIKDVVTPNQQVVVINDEKLLAKDKYLNFLSQVLSQTKGEHRCDNSVEYAFSLHQLGKMVQNRFGSEEIYDEAAALVEEELSNPLKDVSSYGISFNIDSNQFSAIQPSYSLHCQVKTFLYEKSIHLMFLGLLGYTLFKFYQHKQKGKNFNRMVQRVYSEIMIELNKTRKECVKDLYDKVANKYGDDFAETVWPHVEQLRLHYGRILIFKDEHNGSYEYFWGI